jgi:putative nucleotidyltransferase with HDIG domain
MNYSKRVDFKIKAYNPKGDLAHTARLFLAMSSVNHISTKDHVERVALLAEAVARALRKDLKAAFFAGLLHDVGKLILPADLFDGHNVDAVEYQHIRTHALAGYKALKKLHLFTALCAGLHHNLYKAGYGIVTEAFPKEWSPATIKKVLEISTIISVCDFIDAFTHRKTEIKDGSDSATGQDKPDLKSMLYTKYPDDKEMIDVAIPLSKNFQ